jgi:hypothetical protein
MICRLVTIAAIRPLQMLHEKPGVSSYCLTLIPHLAVTNPGSRLTLNLQQTPPLRHL